MITDSIPRGLYIAILLVMAFVKFVTVASWYMHLRSDRPIFQRLFIIGGGLGAAARELIVAPAEAEYRSRALAPNAMAPVLPADHSACPTRMTRRRAAAALGTRIFSIPFSSEARTLSVSISVGNSNIRDIGSTTCSRWR